MSAHRVPIYLSQPDGIGRFTLRQIFLGGAALFYVAPAAWNAAPQNGPAFGDLLHAIYPGLGWIFQPGSLPFFPILYASIASAPLIALALPLDPPAEHGGIAAGKWARWHGDINRDQFAANLGHVTVSGNRFDTDWGMGGVWEVPGRNLRLAAAADVEQAQDLWGEFLNGLTKPIQTLTVAQRVDPETIVGRIERYTPAKNSLAWLRNGRAASTKGTDRRTPRENAQRLAAWLRTNARNAHLIERRHFLAFHAEDEQEFADTETEIADGLGALGLRTDQIRRLEGDELKTVIQRTWSPLAAGSGKLGIGPHARPFVHWSTIHLDGEWHCVVALGTWPRIARDNALAPLNDGTYEVDVIEYIAPVEADEILSGLERRADAMKFGANRKRSKAVDDLEDFISSLSDGVESPFDVSVLLHVHAPEKKIVDTETKKILKRVRRSGARARRLTWEQAKAMQAVAPLGLNHLDNRTKRVDTSSVKRLYPWGASAMWMDDAVPWGETIDSHRPVGLNVWRRPLIANPHIASYMMSGGGKGFGWKCFSSRELFAGVVDEIFSFDQAEEDLELGEYGKWAEYCGIEYRHVTKTDDFNAALADLDNYRWLGPGICWNIAQLPLADRPEFFVRTKEALWRRATALKAHRQWAIDELWSFVKTGEAFGASPIWQAGCVSAIEDIVRRGRHLQMGGVFMTQRAKDSLDVSVMEIIQSQCATQIYGPQNPKEITDVREGLQWTDAEVSAIKKLIPGEALIAAGPWRVAMRVTASEDEYAMANTDGAPSREATLPSTEEDPDDNA